VEKKNLSEVQGRHEKTSIAVFVDAENVPLMLTREALISISARGQIGYVEVVGDRSNIWRINGLRREYPVQLTDVPCEKKAGQSADVALTVAVMKMLERSDYRMFAIVSSDRDFYSLILELKARGMVVIAAGEDKATSAYQNTADEFITLGRPNVGRRLSNGEHEFLNAARSASGGEWIHLSALGNILRDKIPGFHPKEFGARSLSALIRSYPEHIELTRLGNDWSRPICRFLD
jgi:hypothetical protein